MAKKLTNNYNLPQPIVDAVANDSYTGGGEGISVTGLLKPPRIAALEKLHKEEIVEDVSDRIWSLMGQAMHAVLERAELPSDKIVSEERISVDINGVSVSGQFDRFVISSGVVQDYKFVTAYKFKNDEVPVDYQQQLNCYAYLLRSRGYDVQRGEVVAIFRDWSKREARRSPDYPQKNVQVYPVDIQPNDKIEAFLKRRVAAFKQALAELPECSDEDRWAKPAKHAVMRKGRKTALRLVDTEKEALDYIAWYMNKNRIPSNKATDFYVNRRESENVRCESYCSVAPFCSQFQKLKGSE